MVLLFQHTLGEIKITLDDATDTNKINIAQGTDNTYEITVYDGAAFEIANEDAVTAIGLDITPLKYQGQTGVTKIIIDESGQIQSINTGFIDSNGEFTSSTDSGIVVSGTTLSITSTTGEALAETATVEGVQVNVTTEEKYAPQWPVKSKKTIIPTIQLTSSDETIDSDLSDSIVKIYPYSSGVNKLTYAGIEYTFNNAGGNAFLMTNENGGIDFIFVDNGDSITIPEEASATTNFYYIDKSSAAYVTNPNSVEPVAVPTVPAVTGSESYTVTMTTATSRRSARAEFTVSDIGAESFVEFGGYPFVFFSAAGGNFTFNQQGQVTNITAASGTVTFYDEMTSFLSQVDSNDRPFLTLDGSTVYIDALTSEYDTLVYNHDDKSLFGLADRSVIHDAGALTKIYAPTAEGQFQFGDLDAEGNSPQTFTAWGSDGDEDDLGSRAYFTVDGDKVTGFTFAAVDDQLTGDLRNLTLTDAPTGNTFAAPVLTSDGNVVESTIIKTVEKINGTNKDCYAFLGQELDGVTANFADGTSVTFNAVNDYTELLFSTTGKLLGCVHTIELRKINE